MGTRKQSPDPKVESLRATRSLNPRPEEVHDEVFTSAEFFDVRDVVQVKYEMVRAVQTGRCSVTVAAEAFGFCRQSYYTAADALRAGGLPALVPAKPGPKRAHKLTEEVLDHLEQLRTSDPHIGAAALAAAVADRFGVGVHPRSVERALTRREAARSSKRG